MSAVAQSHQSNDVWAAPVARHPLNAVVDIPGSKSLSNRYLILAALSSSQVTIRGLLRSRDTELMIDALRSIGVEVDIIDGDWSQVRVTPPVSGRFRGNVTVFCGLAGTVMRFVPPLALFADGPVTFDGDAQAYARPMGPLVEGLEQLGASVEYQGRPGFLPLTVIPAANDDNTAGIARVSIDASTSSQFISGLLLAASRLPQGLELRHTGDKLPSMPHICMTMEDVNDAGGSITMPEPSYWHVEPAELSPGDRIVVEPDLSNAAPFLGAACIVGGSVSIPRWPVYTAQPGALLPSILERLGAHCTLNQQSGVEASEQASGVMTVKASGGHLHGLGEFDLSQAGEIAPSIAALATLAETPTTLLGIGHLRGHETNRLAALVSEIERIGAHARELPDGIEITPVPWDDLKGAIMHTYGDHRMATFAAMIGLAVPNTQVIDIATTAKTLPNFVTMWHSVLN